jgi:hypothetical protein
MPVEPHYLHLYDLCNRLPKSERIDFIKKAFKNKYYYRNKLYNESSDFFRLLKKCTPDERLEVLKLINDEVQYLFKTSTNNIVMALENLPEKDWPAFITYVQDYLPNYLYQEILVVMAKLCSDKTTSDWVLAFAQSHNLAKINNIDELRLSIRDIEDIIIRQNVLMLVESKVKSVKNNHELYTLFKLFSRNKLELTIQLDDPLYPTFICDIKLIEIFIPLIKDLYKRLGPDLEKLIKTPDDLDYVIDEFNITYIEMLNTHPNVFLKLSKDKDSFFELYNKLLSKEEKRIFLELIAEKLPKFVKDSSDLQAIIINKSPQDASNIFKWLGNKLTRLISSKKDFHRIYDQLSPPLQIVFCQQLQKHLPHVLPSKEYKALCEKHNIPQYKNKCLVSLFAEKIGINKCDIVTDKKLGL